jgi:hypothetical protein
MRVLFLIFFLLSNSLVVNNVFSTSQKDIKTPTPKKTNWNYQSQLVGIDKVEMKFLTTRSLNSLNLNFPYNGKNYGEITFRNSEKHGIRILFSIDKGQIQCGVYVCKGRIKFDNTQSIEFNGDEPSSGSNDTIFIRKNDNLIELFKSSKKVFIEVPLYREGNQILEFNIEGLNLELLNITK